MALRYIANQQTWKGEPINGVSHPRTIETLWKVEDLASVGLEKVPPPAPPPVNLTEYLANTRWMVETGGIVVNGVAVATHDRAKTLVAGAASASNPDTDTLKFKTESGWIDLTFGQVRAIRNAITSHVQACFAKEAELAAGIESGIITTTAQIDNADWPSNGGA